MKRSEVDLQVGDKLILRNGDCVEVVSIDDDIRQPINTSDGFYCSRNGKAGIGGIFDAVYVNNVEIIDETH